MDITEKVKEITNNYKLILPIEEAKALKLHGGPGNGSGNRTKLSKLFINTVIYGSKREPFTYPSCYEELINISDYEIIISEYKKKRIEKGLSSSNGGVIGFIIHSENLEGPTKSPIRSDIKKYYKKFPCITCGTKKTICDHKNDLYNDPRVLCLKTQKLEDFQPLCNNCNLRKRAVSIKTRKENKRQPPPPNIRCLGIDYISGNETFDSNDPNTMVGTYWYDPLYFVQEVKKIMSQDQTRYYSKFKPI